MEIKQEALGKGYLGFLGITMALSAIVFKEPAPYDIAMMILLIAAMLSSYLDYSRDISITVFCLSLFILGNLLSLFVVVNSSRGFWFLGVTLYLVLSWFLFTGLLEHQGHKLLSLILSGYTLAALFSTLITILAFFELIPLGDLLIKYGRATGFFKDPNVFGPFLVPIALYGMVKIDASVGLKRFYWLLIFLITTIGVLLSFSRAGWLNYGVAIFVYLLFGGFVFNKRKFFTNVIVISLLIFTLVTVINIPHVSEIFIYRLGFLNYDEARFNNQRTALDNSFENLLGIGPGQSEYTYDIATHNLYIRVFTENGVIGILGFLAFILSTLARSIRWAITRHNPYQPIYAILTASILGLLANSFFIDTLHWRHFWLLLALPWMNLGNPNGTGGKEAGEG